uniref:Uncharacterized protein n=1 Tax=Schistosoma mansoni TaxID=6183 RepID=A0A146MG48_SCHMA
MEKEAFALVFAMRRFVQLETHTSYRSQVSPRNFLVKSDKPAHSANRLQRWTLVLLGYDFKIQCRRPDNSVKQMPYHDLLMIIRRLRKYGNRTSASGKSPTGAVY